MIKYSTQVVKDFNVLGIISGKHWTFSLEAMPSFDRSELNELAKVSGDVIISLLYALEDIVCKLFILFLDQKEI